MASLTGKVAWVTGAGSGIGQAAAIALAKEGATVVLTGRRKEPLDETAATIKKAGGKAMVKPGDLMKAAAVTRIAADIDKKLGRCDILVNNAGLNIVERSWKQLSPAGAEQVIDGNLSSAFYCTTAVLPLMRKNKDGVLIHTSSMAGRQASLLSGPAYSAAKHGVVAMSHTINMEECVNGIRSCVVCPGEVATPILDKRPIPITKEERARMAQSEDVGDLIRYIACLPPHIVINEVMINPTWNRRLRRRPSARQGVAATFNLILRSARRARLEGWATDEACGPSFETHRCAMLLRMRSDGRRADDSHHQGQGAGSLRRGYLCLGGLLDGRGRPHRPLPGERQPLGP